MAPAHKAQPASREMVSAHQLAFKVVVKRKEKTAVQELNMLMLCWPAWQTADTAADVSWLQIELLLVSALRVQHVSVISSGAGWCVCNLMVCGSNQLHLYQSLAVQHC